MSDTVTRITIGEREIVIVGTAHISKESVLEVKNIINDEKPDRVCIELDESRHKSITQSNSWRNLNITQVLKQGKGFLLLSNLVLSSFQRRMGMQLGNKPGEEMLAAIEVCNHLEIPYSLCDREIQTTLKRAWSKSGLWGKNKMLAAMLSAIFTREKLSEEELENLKSKSALQGMLEELAQFLPSAKEVLIDERDIYLATRIFQADGKRIVAVVGAGHVPGIIKRLNELHEGKADFDLTGLDQIPPKGILSKSLPWVLPVAIIGAIIAGFFIRGSDVTLNNMLKWVLVNGSLAAVGSIIALAHPLTILLAFLAAPITSLIPVIGVGIFTGILEAALRKPRVSDFENLPDDLLKVKGFFKNRFTHVFIVFFLSSVGSSIGTFIGGIPLFTSLFG